jgi:hypothetical protein
MTGDGLTVMVLISCADGDTGRDRGGDERFVSEELCSDARRTSDSRRPDMARSGKKRKQAIRDPTSERMDGSMDSNQSVALHGEGIMGAKRDEQERRLAAWRRNGRVVRSWRGRRLFASVDSVAGGRVANSFNAVARIRSGRENVAGERRRVRGCAGEWDDEDQITRVGWWGRSPGMDDVRDEDGRGGEGEEEEEGERGNARR